MDLTEIIALLGGWTLLIGGIAAWIGKLIIERFKLRWQERQNRELEELRREYEFDLDKRKRRYAGKLEQYQRYFRILDQYTRASRTKLFQNFRDGIMQMVEDPSEDNLKRHVSNMMELMDSSNELYLTVMSEISGLKLEAGETLLALLKQYEAVLKDVNDRTGAFIQSVSGALTGAAMDGPEAIQATIAEHFGDIIEQPELEDLQERIFQEMRKELEIS